MKKTLLVGSYILIVILGIIVYMGTNGLKGKNYESVQAGEKVYNQQCLICHGENGKGEGKNAGTALNNQNFLNSVSDKDLYNYIEFGRPDAAMPAYGPRLNKEQLKNLVAFIRNWQTMEKQFEVPNTITGDAEAGEKIYTASCLQCHGEAAQGIVKMGTALADPLHLKYVTDKQLWIGTAYGREGTRMASSLKGLDGVRQLEKQEISDVVTYIQSLEK